MLRTRIHVNLKSEPLDRAPSAGEWLRALFGKDVELASGREQLTLSSYGVLKGIVRAFERVGVTNVIAFVVDDRDVYVDARNTEDDLQLIEQRAGAQRIFDGPFDVMHMVLEHRTTGLHTLIDVEVHREVLLRQPEMRVDVVTRLEALRPKAGEGAAAFFARIRAWARDTAALEQARGIASRLAAPIAKVLGEELESSVVSVEPTRFEIVLPTEEEVHAFVALSFGEGVSEGRYRPTPARQGLCKYGVPVFAYYYDDPFYDLVDWILAHELFDGKALRRSDLTVVDKSGDSLLVGADADGYPAHRWPGYRAVHLDGARIVRSS